MTDVAEAQDDDVAGEVQDTEIEEKARDGGWVPEDEWEGDPPEGGFRTAQEFLDYGEKRGPALHDQNQRLTEQLAASDQRLDEMQRTMGELRDFHKGAQTRAVETARQQLEDERRKAVETGDVPAYDAAGEKIAKLDETPAEPVQNPDDDPEFKAWMRDNAWYNDNIKMTIYADQAAGVIKGSKKLTGRALYDAAAEAVRDEFPGYFTNANRNDPPHVEGGGAPSISRKSGKTYADLPADAKAACDGFCETMVTGPDGKQEPLMTRKEYLADYEWGE